LAERTGFWPLFLAVGSTDNDLRMTGYANQFQRPSPTVEVPNNSVLFSWLRSPSTHLRYTCYDHWHIALNCVSYPDYPHSDDKKRHRTEIVGMTPQMESWVFHNSWKESDWLRMARRDPHSVQGVVPQLDLRSADEVWCRNKGTRRELLRMGFREDQVIVKRLAVNYDEKNEAS